jgi:hypothetical protein
MLFARHQTGTHFWMSTTTWIAVDCKRICALIKPPSIVCRHDNIILDARPQKPNFCRRSFSFRLLDAGQVTCREAMSKDFLEVNLIHHVTEHPASATEKPCILLVCKELMGCFIVAGRELYEKGAALEIFSREYCCSFFFRSVVVCLAAPPGPSGASCFCGDDPMGRVDYLVCASPALALC